MALPTANAGQPGLAGGADHLATRCHHQLSRGDGHAHVAMDPRMHDANLYEKSAKCNKFSNSNFSSRFESSHSKKMKNWHGKASHTIKRIFLLIKSVHLCQDFT